MSPHSDSSLGKTSSRQRGKAFTLNSHSPSQVRAADPHAKACTYAQGRGGCRMAPAWEVSADSSSCRGRAAPLGPGMSPWHQAGAPHAVPVGQGPRLRGAPREASGPPARSALEQPTPLLPPGKEPTDEPLEAKVIIWVIPPLLTLRDSCKLSALFSWFTTTVQGIPTFP